MRISDWSSDVCSSDLVTKVGARRGDDASWLPEQSPEELTQQVHDNLRNLGLERLHVVNLRSMLDVHGPKEGSLEPQLTALAELQHQGLIRHKIGRASCRESVWP